MSDFVAETPMPGDRLPCTSKALPGYAWTGFEWVEPARYEELRATTMPELPPLQPAPGEAQMPAQQALAYAAELQAASLGAHPAPAAAWGIDGAWDTPAGVVPVLGPPAPQAPTAPRVLPMPRLVRQMLIHLDPDFLRGGLAETPDRVAKAWAEWTAGYQMDPAEILKVFEDGAEGCDEMVVVADIPVYSHCEHHLASIFGTATIAYIPNGKIVGLSKLPRLVDVFARRLQVQERMTNQIANALMEHLAPLGCGVVIKARHMCMESRGIRQAGTHTVTSALRGLFRDDAQVRAEFLALAR